METRAQEMKEKGERESVRPPRRAQNKKGKVLRFTANPFRVKAWLLSLALCLLSLAARAQTTTTVTGTIKDLTGTPVVSGQVTFDLKPGIDTTISGNARFTPQTVTCAISQPQIVVATGASRSSNVVTITTVTAHGFSIGDSVIVTGVTDTSFNGTFTVATVPTTTTLTYSQTAANATSGGGNIGGVMKLGGTGACVVTQNTALTPANTYYQVCLYPSNVKTSCFNFFAIGSSVDISTAVPTPATLPAYAFVDTTTTQTVTGAKTFSAATNFSSSITTFGLTLNGNAIPGATTVYDLGSGTLKWRNLYAQNLGDASNPVSSVGTLTAVGDFLAKSGTPWIDVQAYGVRAINQNASFQTTATVAAGSTSATLAAASIFINGDGVVIYGAGATNTLTTPAAPTVTPSQSAGATNTGITVAAPAGATSYNYQIVLRDKNGGLTAASVVGTSAVGQAALGAVSVAVTSLSRANNVVSVVMSAAFNVSVGAIVYMTASTDATFSGYYPVATVTDSTHFTYNQGQDTRAGASASATGGTAQMYACNKLTLPAYPANGWQYYIYGRTGASLTLLGVTKPLDTVWEDYGSPFMDGIVLPSYVPTAAPPTVATNDYLVTTIVSGAGTTTLTLANAATNAVTTATIKFDNAPNILTAANAAAAVTGTRPSVLYFSATTSGNTYVVNSYLTLPASITIWQNHALYLNETLQIGSNTIWLGDMGGGAFTIPQFALSQERPVYANAANPGIYVSNGGSDYFRGLGFTNLNNQGTIMVIDGANFNTSFEYTSFLAGASGTDYTGMDLIIRGGAEFLFRKCLFSVSDPAAFGSSLTPTLFMRNDLAQVNGSGELHLDDVFFVGRGVTHDSTPSIGSVTIRARNIYTQAMRSPLLSISHSSNQLAVITIDGIQNDTTTAAVLALWGSTTLEDVIIQGSNELSAEAGGRPGQVTGNSIAQLKFLNMSSVTNFGQNQSVVRVDNSTVTTPTVVLTGPNNFGGTLTHANTAARTYSFPDATGTVALVLTGTSASLGGSSIAANTCIAGTVTVTGATTSMTATASPTTYPGDGFEWKGYISTANTVTVRICNRTDAAATPTASTYNVRVIQ